MAGAGGRAFVGARSSLGLAGRLWQKLLKVFQEVGRRVEQRRNLSVDVLNRLLLALVGLQDLQKLFVYLWLVLKAVLRASVIRLHLMIQMTLTLILLT